MEFPGLVHEEERPCQQVAAQPCWPEACPDLPSPQRRAVSPEASPPGAFQSVQKGHIALPNGGSYPGQRADRWRPLGHHPNQRDTLLATKEFSAGNSFVSGLTSPMCEIPRYCVFFLEANVKFLIKSLPLRFSSQLRKPTRGGPKEFAIPSV